MVMYNWYNSGEGGEEIGPTRWILFDEFANQGAEKGVQKDGAYRIRTY